MKHFDKPLRSLMAMFLLLSVLWSSGATRANGAVDPVLAWNQIMVRTVAPSPPFIQSRAAAMMHIAVFEAVNAIVGGYEPYRGTITAPVGASPEAAAIAAAHHILVTLFPGSAGSLNADLAVSLAAIADGGKASGIAVGIAAADAILALRADDGAAQANQTPYTPGTGPGYWQPTPPANAAAVFVGWGQVDTFGIEDGTQFRSGPPPALHTGKYANDYDEVKSLGRATGSTRTADQTNLALLFGFNSPVHLFNSAARQASAAEGLTLAENARSFALLNMAMADALITSMESKFFYSFWRPVTAIRAGESDGNKHTAGDPNWLSLVPTPAYPSHPSNYASVVFAVQRVLAASFGDGGHDITLLSNSTNPIAANLSLHITSFSELADAVYMARIYGGIHFRWEMKDGSLIGKHVGSYILTNELRPTHGQE